MRAFSLVELSIVLVILGLLTGGILAGQNLIRAAELRGVVTDLHKYHTAVMTFRDKYFALPGDMPNAVQFWGARDGATTDGLDTTCDTLTTPATGAETCNGNGDGRIQSREVFRAWNHMANAGLIEGTYTGIPNAGGTLLAIPGENTPQSKISNVGFSILTANEYTADSGSWFIHDAGLLFSVGKKYTDNELRIGFLLPEEAWNIDKKIDDGKPSYGKMLSRRTLDCTTTDVTETAEYLLTGQVQDCIIRYFMR